MMTTTPHNQTINTVKVENSWRKIAVVLFGLLATLIIANLSIHRYETHLASGDKLLLELAPVDPRGLMQGDYMALSYAINDEIYSALLEQTKAKVSEGADTKLYDRYNLNTDGMAVVKKNSNMVGQFDRLLPVNELNDEILAPNELLLYFRVRNGQVKLATNAFFFQEGHGEAYEAAKYGLFRVNDEGAPLLSAMVNDDFEVIEPQNINSGWEDDQ